MPAMTDWLLGAGLLWLVAGPIDARTDPLRSCKRRSDATPLSLGVFSVQKPPYPDVLPAIHTAMRHIHDRTCLLDGHKIKLVVKDTQCKTSIGMKALFDLIAARPRPVAILGGVCTQVNEPIAMALKYWQIVQLSYAETHAKFASSDTQEMFATFFRIVPGSRNTNAAKCRLVTRFGWKRVGTVKQSDQPRFALPHEALTTRLEHGFGVKVVHTAGVNREQIDAIGSQLDELKERDVRVVVMDADAAMSAKVMCAAYHRTMFGDNYVWILPGFHSNSWMDAQDNCTAEQMELVLRNHFAVEFALTRNDADALVAGYAKAGDIWDELSRNDKNNTWRGYLYDGLLTLALALDAAMDDSGEFSHPRMLSAISNISFDGVTGKVRFVNNERLGLVDVLQWKQNQYVAIGQYDGAADKLDVFQDRLHGWTAPLDSTVVEKVREYISSMLFIAMSFLALVGISLAFIFLLINFKYRNHRFIKMSSPNLNNIIIVGSICTFASVILLGIDTRILSAENFVRMCYIKTWTLCLGFTFAFGSMFSKTWRVHSIFTNIRMDRKAIKDSKLLMILGALLLIDIVVLTAWGILSPFSFSVIELPHIPYENKVIVPQVERCHSNNSVVFQAVLYASKGILMILGCFLAWETRHVNVPALNDSKYIGMSVYNVVVMSVLGLSTSVILQERVNESFALASFFVIFSTTLTLCLVFVPKVIELARNPAGNEPRAYRRGLMKSVVAKTSQPASPIPNSGDNASDMLTKAETENKVRRRYLHQKTAQLWDLVEKLRAQGDSQFLQQGDVTDWPWVDPDEPSTKL